MHLNEMH